MTLNRLLIAALIGLGLSSCGGGDSATGDEETVVLATIGSNSALANVPAKRLFGAETTGSAQSPGSYGSYSKGCLAGSAQLAETGPTWQAMRLSRNRNWAHPETVGFVQSLSARAAQLPGWNGLYVGDMSQPRGGPMTSGHASHQIGLDADIWLRPTDSLRLSAAQRESISSISMQRSKGAFVNDYWTPAHHALIRAAASDPRVARIFIFPGAKVQMCNDEKGDRSWLGKVRPWYGHDSHFHVRLKCPRGASGCVNQTPPPPGDGCADAQAWVNNILNPPPPDPNAPKPRPKRDIVMAELPAQCAAVLESR